MIKRGNHYFILSTASLTITIRNLSKEIFKGNKCWKIVSSNYLSDDLWKNYALILRIDWDKKEDVFLWEIQWKIKIKSNWKVK